MSEPLVATTFRFRVELTSVPGGSALGDGGFQECTGLEIELEVSDYPEGGRNDGLVPGIGRAKHPRIVLRRGMLHAAGGRVNSELWAWMAGTVEGELPIRRHDGTVRMYGAGWAEVAAWTFRRAIPAKIVGPQLNARTGEIAIEELHLAHEGLRLVRS